MPYENSTFGARVRYLRNQKGWKQDRLALEANLSQAEISRIENGHFRQPSEQTIRKLAYALEIQPEVLIGNPSYAAGFKNNQGVVRNHVFISYSHKDSRWLERLQVHLKPFERVGIINRWDDTKIEAGQNWREEIRKAIRVAKVIVLLVSADFLASDFIANNELPPLLAAAESDGATILSIVLKPCSFSHAGNISKYQAINPPNKTLAQLSGAERERIFSILTDRIVALLQNN